MLSYRTHVYTFAMSASAAATDLALAISDCVAEQRSAEEPRATITNHLPTLLGKAQSLSSAVDKFYDTLPPELREDVDQRTRLGRHLYWINRRLDEGHPGACTRDPVDIACADIPDVLELFETWYERHSPTDSKFGTGLKPHIDNGNLNAALREAWPVFKTRMVDAFGLPDDIDGHRLADRLFGTEGTTADLLSDKERKAYLNLFKGLYSLSRNSVLHGDVPTDPEVATAVLALINSALVRLEDARDDESK